MAATKHRRRLEASTARQGRAGQGRTGRWPGRTEHAQRRGASHRRVCHAVWGGRACERAGSANPGHRKGKSGRAVTCCFLFVDRRSRALAATLHAARAVVLVVARGAAITCVLGSDACLGTPVALPEYHTHRMLLATTVWRGTNSRTCKFVEFVRLRPLHKGDI